MRVYDSQAYRKLAVTREKINFYEHCSCAWLRTKSWKYFLFTFLPTRFNTYFPLSLLLCSVLTSQKRYYQVACYTWPSALWRNDWTVVEARCHGGTLGTLKASDFNVKKEVLPGLLFSIQLQRKSAKRQMELKNISRNSRKITLTFRILNYILLPTQPPPLPLPPSIFPPCPTLSCLPVPFHLLGIRSQFLSRKWHRTLNWL